MSSSGDVVIIVAAADDDDGSPVIVAVRIPLTVRVCVTTFSGIGSGLSVTSVCIASLV